MPNKKKEIIEIPSKEISFDDLATKKDQKSLLDRGLEISNSFLFKTLLGRAGGFLLKPLAVIKVLNKAIRKSKKYNSFGEFGGELLSNVNNLFAMVKAYAKGEYKGLKHTDVAMMLAGILYFLTPIDLIPDAIPVIGLMDDISIISWLINKFTNEIDQFARWKYADKNSLTQMTYDQLYQIAKEEKIKGRSKMKKSELAAAIGFQTSEVKR